MELYNPTIYLENVSTEIRHAQVVYLEKIMNVPRETIAKITRYARSTIRTLVSTFKGQVKKLKRYFIDRNKYAIGESTYIVKIFSNRGNFIKIGKTDNLNRRVRELENYYKGSVQVLKHYLFTTAEVALSMEDLMRAYFKKYYNFHRQDRFDYFELTEKDYNEMLSLSQDVNYLFHKHGLA